ncbi:hypothetical protein GALMADRAFT_145131 [Galerina marginata CBS 339.88]|uniref:Uncharacterized protein n=1 Tax=Galerina marginata (strain CBS 339.88) TaxID=685588 RepID=A0A067SI68_GALM3|nr:hypothetical protein GALMADRAFT_145131 [Galerina marginata CBS 339.88]
MLKAVGICDYPQYCGLLDSAEETEDGWDDFELAEVCWLALALALVPPKLPNTLSSYSSSSFPSTSCMWLLQEISNQNHITFLARPGTTPASPSQPEGGHLEPAGTLRALQHEVEREVEVCTYGNGPEVERDDERDGTGDTPTEDRAEEPGKINMKNDAISRRTPAVALQDSQGGVKLSVKC